MFKLLLILLLSVNLSALDNDQSDNMLSTNTTIIYGIGGTVVVVSGVIAAPLVLPAGAIVIIQTTGNCNRNFYYCSWYVYSQ